jgi:hypothetical protein
MPSEVALPEPIFVGFFPKRAALSSETIKAPGVDRIHSVSHCISEAPNDWIDRWLHNDLGFYDDEETARSTIVDPEGFEIYAYTIVPLRWNEDHSVESWVPPRAPDSLPQDYELLGYDAVSKSFSSFFERSPLSCNAGFEAFNVNEHCLFPDLEAAGVALPRIVAGNYEPGDYFLVGVYRKHS